MLFTLISTVHSDKSKSNSSVIVGVIGHWGGGVEGGNVILGVIGQCGGGGARVTPAKRVFLLVIIIETNLLSLPVLNILDCAQQCSVFWMLVFFHNSFHYFVTFAFSETQNVTKTIFPIIWLNEVGKSLT